MEEKFLKSALDRFLENLKWCIENDYEITPKEILEIQKMIAEKGYSPNTFRDMSSFHPLFLGFDEFEMQEMLNEYKSKAYRMEL